MILKNSACLVGLMAMTLLVPAGLHAQGKGKKKREKKEQEAKEVTAPQEAGDPKELAKEAYRKGKELYDKDEFQASLESFITAYNYMPNPFVYISIAQCYDKLGKCQEARDYYLKYIQEKPDAGNIPDIKEKIAELEARSGKVRIVSEPAGASITLDGETTEMVTPVGVDLQGGDHALALNRDGYIMETRAFTVPFCGEVEVSVKMKPAEPVSIETGKSIEEAIAAVEGEEERPAKMKIKLGIPHYVAFGLAGAAAVTAIVTGGLAMKKSNEFADKKDAYQSTQDQDLRDKYYREMDDIKSKGGPLAIVCDLSIGVAAVAAVTGVALLFIGPKETSEVSVIPAVTPAGGGAFINVNF